LKFRRPTGSNETSIVSGSALAECVWESKNLAGGYLFELTECEYLHFRMAVEQDRNRTIKAIAKGRAHPQDLAASDSLWNKLEYVAFSRMFGGRS